MPVERPGHECRANSQSRSPLDEWASSHICTQPRPHAYRRAPEAPKSARPVVFTRPTSTMIARSRSCASCLAKGQLHDIGTHLKRLEEIQCGNADQPNWVFCYRIGLHETGWGATSGEVRLTVVEHKGRK